MTDRAEIGVIGGSGFYSLLEDVREIKVDTPTSQAKVWFRLDMPSAVTSGAGQTLKVTFTGVAQ